MNNRFRLEKSKELEGWWMLIDTENLIIVRFEEHKFNDTQEVSILDDSNLTHDANIAGKLSRILQEMDDYMFRCWYSVAHPAPAFEFREDNENDRVLLIRNKYPKFTVEIQDKCEAYRLASALKKAGEFVDKIGKNGRK